MPDIGATVKVSIPLFILGLISSLAGSILVSAILKAGLYATVTLIVELVFAAILIGKNTY
jgi:hypothetical protein